MRDFEISVMELKQKLIENPNILILDVREPHEFEICNLGGVLIPLGTLSARIDELDKSQEIAVLCHSGYRSRQATLMLRQLGFNAKNIVGGIDAWAREVDPSLATY